MAEYALTADGHVVNVVIVDPDDAATLKRLGAGHDAVVRIDTLEERPGIGWLYDGATLTRPPRPPFLEADRLELAADDTDTVTVALVDEAGDITDLEVTFTVNGADAPPVPMTDGRAELELTAQAAGPVIVEARGLRLELTATAP